MNQMITIINYIDLLKHLFYSHTIFKNVFKTFSFYSPQNPLCANNSKADYIVLFSRERLVQLPWYRPWKYVILWRITLNLTTKPLISSKCWTFWLTKYLLRLMDWHFSNILYFNWYVLFITTHATFYIFLNNQISTLSEVE